MSSPGMSKGAVSVTGFAGRNTQRIQALDGECEWEPEAASEMPTLEEINDKIADLTAHLQANGRIVSGRIILVCHALPYTCALVNDNENEGADSDDENKLAANLASNTRRPTLEIRRSDSAANPSALHAFHPSTIITTEIPEHPQERHWDMAKPMSAAHHLMSSLSGASTPKSILQNPFDLLGSNNQGSSLSRNNSFYNGASSIHDRTNGSAKPVKHQRWVLTPRRGHAALNAGIRALAVESDVTLVAWPGDMRRGIGGPDDEDTGDLSHDDISKELRADLDQGLATIGGQGKGASCRAVWLEDQTSKDFYDGYCKSFLWPVFHYFSLNDQVDKNAEARAWKAYVAANQKYADAVLAEYHTGDLIWVHDYHLMLVPRMIRNKIPDATIGFFLHSPFPSSEMFRCLPRREAILEGLLGSDLCCFQTWSYGRHFLSSCVRVMGYETSSDGEGHVDHRGSITRIMHSPIGVDADRIEQDRTKAGVKPKIEALRELYGDKKIIVGRDKLDPTKGVIPKLQAFERFLLEYPVWIGRAVLIIVTSPSPTDSVAHGTKVSELLDRINGEYGSLHFQPVHHYHQTIDRDEYFALLSVADLALVTSIRDGMNTTSMEYAICQQENKNPLLLSEYCGISTSLSSAVRINPWDIADCARAIEQCLTMSAKEKAIRHAELYRRVTKHTAAVWANELVLKLLDTRNDVEATINTQALDTQVCREKYTSAKKRLLFFDYDGTLTPIVKTPSAALPSQQLLETLTALAADTKNVLYIISGRDSAFLEQTLGHIKGVGFSAEHGCFLKTPGSTEWRDLTEGLDMSWRKDVEDIFRYYEVRTTGSFVEIKKAAITFHHRNADPTWGEFQAKECQAVLESMQTRLAVDVMVGKRNLEVRPAHTNKGEIVKRLMQEHLDAEFVICSGDDKTDEDMFRALRHVQVSIADDNRTPTISATVRLPQPNLVETPAVPHFSKSTLKPDDIFTVVIDVNPYRKTLAQWQCPSPEEHVVALELLSKS